MAETLPRQAESAGDVGYKGSLARVFQLTEALEDLFDAVLGRGVLSGGVVTQQAAFTARVATGAVLVSGGYVYTLGANQDYSGLTPSATNYLWGAIERTPADSASLTYPTDLDTYALDLAHTTTGTAPSADHFLLATLVTDGSGITSINSDPTGKYVTGAGFQSVIGPDPGSRHTVPNVAADTVTLNAATQTLTNKTLTSPTINGGTFSGGTDLAVADGGTGASSASAARTNLGAAASGANADITSLSALSTPLSVAQGGTGGANAGDARTNLGLGGLAVLSAVGAGEITDGSVGVAELAAAVQDALGAAPSLTAAAEAADARQISIQLKDAAGNNLAERRLVRVVVADTQFGAECAVAPSGGVTVDTGTVLQAVTAGKQWVVESDATGLVQVTLTEAGVVTFWLRAWLDSRGGNVAVAFV